MIKNEELYNKVKERQSEDVVKITFTKKIRKCGICGSMVKAEDITFVKYPIIHETMGRLIMDKRVCTKCHGEVKEVLNNLKYN